METSRPLSHEVAQNAEYQRTVEEMLMHECDQAIVEGRMTQHEKIQLLADWRRQQKKGEQNG